MKDPAILNDATRCVGCFECQRACKQENHLPPERRYRWTASDGLSATAYTSILRHRSGALVRLQCRHCLEPACVSACPVGALHKSPEGAVVYDAGRCLGCRYCMMACPYGIPRYQWNSPVPYVQKCTLCAPRIARGREPACTEACPEKATVFGDRSALLAEARRRIAAEPKRYRNHVWGEREVGGTRVLYIAGIDLGFLALGRAPGERPMPSRTAPAMHAVPFAFLGMGALCGLVYWISGRRERLSGRGADASREPSEAAAESAASESAPAEDATSKDGGDA